MKDFELKPIIENEILPDHTLSMIKGGLNQGWTCDSVSCYKIDEDPCVEFSCSGFVDGCQVYCSFDCAALFNVCPSFNCLTDLS